MCLNTSHHHGHHGGRGVSRRALLTGGAAATAAVATAAALPTSSWAATRDRIADLTHTLTDGFPVYGLDPPSSRTLLTIPEAGLYLKEWTFGEHSGTHIDVPGHFRSGGRLLDQITAPELVGLPVAVIDVSGRAATDPDTEVTVDDLSRYERRHGRILRGAVVFMYSGWESRLPLGAAAYRGEDASGGFHFPGWSATAVEWLLNHRGVSSVGVDTLSLDPGRSTTLDVHHLLLGDADRIGLENVAHLANIPAGGASLTIGAIPLKDGSGGPCRLFATW